MTISADEYTRETVLAEQVLDVRAAFRSLAHEVRDLSKEMQCLKNEVAGERKERKDDLFELNKVLSDYESNVLKLTARAIELGPIKVDDPGRDKRAHYIIAGIVVLGILQIATTIIQKF